MEGWGRLAELIRSASAARYGTTRQLATAARVSTRTVDDLLAGRRTSYRDSTLHAIEAALGWEHGSVVRIVEGGKPRLEADLGLAVIRDEWPHLSARDRRVVLALIEALRR